MMETKCRICGGMRKAIAMLLLFCTTVLAQYCPNGSYVNSYGNTVCRPSSSNIGGATAVCNDGTYSYSQSRRGTCSGHGGVAQWLGSSEPTYEQPTYEPPTYYVQPTYNQPTYEPPTYYVQPTYKQPTYTQSSSESIDFDGEIGWQYIWDMHHFRWSVGLFYNTIGLDLNYDSNDFNELEWIVGAVKRWGIMKSITIGFGVFGGIGARHSNYKVCDYYEQCDTEQDTNMRHELGAELILGVFSLYISERNFYRIGGGIGFIF